MALSLPATSLPLPLPLAPSMEGEYAGRWNGRGQQCHWQELAELRYDHHSLNSWQTTIQPPHHPPADEVIRRGVLPERQTRDHRKACEGDLPTEWRHLLPQFGLILTTIIAVTSSRITSLNIYNTLTNNPISITLTTLTTLTTFTTLTLSTPHHSHHPSPPSWTFATLTVFTYVNTITIFTTVTAIANCTTIADCTVIPATPCQRSKIKDVTTQFINAVGFATIANAVWMANIERPYKICANVVYM